MKILLCCNAGMSTSLMVTKMKKEATNRNMEVQISAISTDKIDTTLEGTDVVMLGPQVRFKEAEIRTLCEPKGIKVDVIKTVDYGMMNGGKVLDAAISLIK